MSTPPSPPDPNTPSTGEGSEKLGPAILISEGSTPPKEVSTSSSSSTTSSSYSTTTSSSSSDSRQRRKRLAKAKLEEARARWETAAAERELIAIEEEEAAEYGSNCSVYDMEWANPDATNDSSVDAGNGSTAGPSETAKVERRKVAPIPLTWFGLEETAPQVPSRNSDRLHADAPKPAADASQLITPAPSQAAESSGSQNFGSLLGLESDGSHNFGSLLGNAPSMAAPPSLLQSNTLFQNITVNLLDLTPPMMRNPMQVPQPGDHAPFAFQQQGGQGTFAFPQQGEWRQNHGNDQWQLPPEIRFMAEESSNKGSTSLLPFLNPAVQALPEDPFPPSQTQPMQKSYTSASGLASLWDAVTNTFKKKDDPPEEHEKCPVCSCNCKDIRDVQCLKLHGKCAMCYLVNDAHHNGTANEIPKESPSAAAASAATNQGTSSPSAAAASAATNQGTGDLPKEGSIAAAASAATNLGTHVETPTILMPTITVPSFIKTSGLLGPASSSSASEPPKPPAPPPAPPPPPPPEPFRNEDGTPFKRKKKKKDDPPDGGGGGDDDDEDDSSSSSSDSSKSSSDTRRKKKKKKKKKSKPIEMVKFTLSALPTTSASLLTWLSENRDLVVGAAKTKQTEVFKYMIRLQSKPIEDLRAFDLGRCTTLDAMLLAEVKRLTKSTLLGKRIQRAADDQASKEVQFRGAVAYKMCIESFEIDVAKGLAFGIEDVQTCAEGHHDLSSTKKIQTFLLAWDSMIGALGPPWNDDSAQSKKMLLHYFWQTVKKCTLIKDEVKTFKRLPESHADKTIETLREHLDFVVREEVLEQNRRDMTKRGHTGGNDGAAAAAQEEGKMTRRQKQQERRKLFQQQRQQAEELNAAPAVTTTQPTRTTTRLDAPKFSEEDFKQMKAKGFCVKFNLGKCDLPSDKCAHQHKKWTPITGVVAAATEKGKGKGKGSGRGRSSSPTPRGGSAAKRSPTPTATDRARTASPFRLAPASAKGDGKTPCAFYQKGKCKLGEKCPFEHVLVAAGAILADVVPGADAAETNPEAEEEALPKSILRSASTAAPKKAATISFAKRLLMFPYTVGVMLNGMTQTSRTALSDKYWNRFQGIGEAVPTVDGERRCLSEQIACQSAETLSRQLGSWSGYVGDDMEVTAAATTDSGLPNEWLIDSGASTPIADKNSIKGDLSPSAKRYSSANGTAVPLGQISKEVLPEAMETIQVMDKTPNLLPCNTLSKHQKGFWWPPDEWGQRPQVLTGVISGPIAKQVHTCTLRRGTPYLGADELLSPGKPMEKGSHLPPRTKFRTSSRDGNLAAGAEEIAPPPSEPKAPAPSSAAGSKGDEADIDALADELPSVDSKKWLDLRKMAHEKNLKEATSTAHLRSHFPKLPWACKICREAKACSVQHRRRNPDIRKSAYKPGELATVDHFKDGDKWVLSAQDLATGYFDACVGNKKDTATSDASLQDMLRSPESLYSDNAPELKRLANRRGVRHLTSTPYDSQSNGIIERCNRKIEEGTAALMLQSGLPEPFKRYATREFSLCATVESGAYELYHGEPYEGLAIPFGAKVSFKLPNPELKRREKSQGRAVEGIYLGCFRSPGGKPSGDYVVVKLEDLSLESIREGKQASIYRTPNVQFQADGTWTFPIAEARQVASLQGLLPPAAIAVPGKMMTEEDQLQAALEAKERSEKEPYRPGAIIDAGELPATAQPEASSSTPMLLVPPIPAPRSYKGSKRPMHIWPEIWSMMTPRQRSKAVYEFEMSEIAALPQRHESITNKRIEKYGATDGCEACLGDKSVQHTSECRKRFDELVAKDKGKEPDESPAPAPSSAAGSKGVGAIKAAEGAIKAAKEEDEPTSVSEDADDSEEEVIGPEVAEYPGRELTVDEHAALQAELRQIDLEKPGWHQVGGIYFHVRKGGGASIPAPRKDLNRISMFARFDNTAAWRLLKDREIFGSTEEIHAPAGAKCTISRLQSDETVQILESLAAAAVAERPTSKENEAADRAKDSPPIGSQQQTKTAFCAAYKDPKDPEGRNNCKAPCCASDIHKGIHIAEICCGANSLLSTRSDAFEGSPDEFHSSRITIKEDLASEKGLSIAKQHIKEASKSEMGLVWLALPCTGGCPWNNINKEREGGAERIQEHLDLFEDLSTNARVAMRYAKSLGVRLAWEWPRCCQLWNNPLASQIVQEFGLEKYELDGCAVGVIATARKYRGLPIKKGWTIATDCPELGSALGECRCDCQGKHAPCAGVDTKKTENYTPQMATLVQNTLYKQILGERTDGEGYAASVIELDCDEAPIMPVDDKAQEHRQKLVDSLPEINAAVARLLTKSEVKADKKAMQAILEEKMKLEARAVWDITTVREYDDLVAEMKRAEKVAHIGRIHAICSEKGSELPPGHPDRKMKGRIVFQGNNVKDQDGNYAIFAELSSCPVAMEASKVCDFYGCLKGHTVEQADARQAYVQSELGGTDTWVELPRELWPDAWAGFRRPVCRLLMALYGHPDAGGYWEKKSFKIIQAAGFVPIDSWHSVFWNPKTKVLLIVYVDDFKAAGPVDAVKKTWQDLKDIDMDPPTPADRFLGCNHRKVMRKDKDGNEYAEMHYDMRDFMQSCCDRYLELANGAGAKMAALKKASTPFLQEDNLTDDDYLLPGVLSSDASKVLMKVLYAARMARPDLLRAVGGLASEVSKWTRASDKKLYKLMCYVDSSKDYVMKGWVSQKTDLGDVFQRLFADADWAGDKKTARSTSGAFSSIEATTGDVFWPIAYKSVKQSCVSASTPEAELVSASCALRTVGIPMMDLLDTVCDRTVECIFEEDNQTCISTWKAGHSPTMRHIKRCHNICLRWLHDVTYELGLCKVKYCDTKEMAADIFTKPFPESCREKWLSALKMLGICIDVT